MGPIGLGIVRVAARRPNLAIVGGIDIAPDKVGRDLGELAGLPQPLGIRVSDKPAGVLDAMRPDVVVHCTGSSLKQVWPQVRDILRAGVNVVSTCEELANPRVHNPDLVAEIDRIATASGATILGTGINPGFAMDAWPLALTAVSRTIDRIVVARVVDAGTRRRPLQAKVGAGLGREEFDRRAKIGAVGHVGLLESVALIADGLGWTLDATDEMIEPVIAVRETVSEYFRVAPGQVAGVHQVARGFRNGAEAITLDLHMYLGAPDPRDEVRIEGEPGLSAVVRGGFPGDLATATVVVNAIRRVVAAPPGLITMKDLPLVSADLGGPSPALGGID